MGALTMGEAIYSARVADIAAVVGGIAWPADTLMILERLPLRWLEQEEIKTGLRFELFEPEAPFNQYERGRVFHEAGELRWEKINRQFWAVYAGSDEVILPADFTRDDSLSLENTEPQTYYLWGKRLNKQALAALDRQPDAPVFAEFTVGGILTEYPAEVPTEKNLEQLALQVVQYIDPETKQLQYYRFQGVSWQ